MSKKQVREDGHRIDAEWKDERNHYEEMFVEKGISICACGLVQKI